MGQKVNPILFRGTNNKNFPMPCSWSCSNRKDYKNFVIEDLRIREYFLSLGSQSIFIASINIERKNGIPRVTVFSSRTSALVNKKGNRSWGTIVDNLKKILLKDVSVNVIDVRTPDLNAQIIANNIAEQIAKRVAYKKAIRSAIKLCMKSGALGIKVLCGGRLNGAEIARSEKFQEGSMSLHKISANIDYAVAKSKTIYGIIGIKVFIYNKHSLFN